MRLFAPDHVHMNLIRYYPHAVTLTAFRHRLQFFARPDFTGWIMRTAQQQNFTFRACRGCIQFVHVAMPAAISLFQRHRHNMALIAFDGFIKCVIGRSMEHHAVADRRPLADELRHHIDHRRAVHQRFSIHLCVVTPGKPVGDRAEKLIILPATVAQYTMREALVQRLQNAGAVAKSISEMVNGSRSAVPKRSAT